jgi:oligosaccharide repeat unit polymerase
MTLEKFISLVLSLCILAQAYGLRRFVGSWVNPGTIFGVFWFVFTFVPMLMVLDAPVDPLAMLFILAASITFSSGSLIFNWNKSIAVNANHGVESQKLYNTGFLLSCFYVTAVFALVFWSLNIAAQGISISSIFTDFLNVSHRYILARYSDSLIVGIYSQLSNMLSYTASALGGLIISRPMTKRERLIVIVGSFLPSILVLTVQGAKGMIFLSLSLFYGGWLIRRVKSGDLTLFDRSHIKVFLIALVSLIPFVTLSFITRGIFLIQNPREVVEVLTRYYASYIAVHLYAFSDWFSWYIGNPSIQFYQESETTYGFFTFMVLFKLFGDDRYVPPGVFDEYYAFGPYLSGNLYTFFRGLIVDFGIAGAMGVLFAVSVASNMVIVTIMRSRYAGLSASLFVVMMGYIYTSFIISLLIWNSAFGLVLALSAILTINQLRFQSTIIVRPFDALPYPRPRMTI